MHHILVDWHHTAASQSLKLQWGGLKKLSLRSVTRTLILRCLQFSQALLTALRFLRSGAGGGRGGGRNGGGSLDRGRSVRSDMLFELEAILEHEGHR